MQAAYQGSSVQSQSSREQIDSRIDRAQTRIPGVVGSVNALEEEIATLGSIADDLIGRLNHVMHADGPQPADPRTQEPRSISCDLDNAIHQRILSVRVIREHLANALQRLEI